MGKKYTFNINNNKCSKVTVFTVSEQFKEHTSPVNQSTQTTTTDNIKEPNSSFCQMIFSWRGVIVLLLYTAYGIHGTTLATVPIALVCMCGPAQAPNENIPSNTSSAFNISAYSNLTSVEDGFLLQEKIYEFNWDSETRGLLLSSVCFAYFLAPVLGNSLRGYLGSKITMAAVTMVLAILNFLSPIAARTNVYVFLAVRILSGFVINSHMPVASDTMAWWLPVREKLSSVSFVIAGWYIGGFLGTTIAGYLCQVPLDGGWPFIFYYNGALAIPWTIALMCLSSRKPEDHRFISDKEKAYIIKNRVGMNQDDNKGKVADSLPYRRIFSSIPVLSYVLVTTAVLFNITIMITCMPVYMVGVLKLSVQEAGTIIGVVWVCRFPASLLWSALGNCLLRFDSINTNRTRKFCFGLGQILAGVSAVGLSFCGKEDKWMASALLLFLFTSTTCGSSISGIVPLDMAPRFAGFITSMGLTVANLISLTGPLFVSTSTTKGSFEEWQLVWITMCIVFLVSGLVFIVFGSASLQPWALLEVHDITVQVEPPDVHTHQNETTSLSQHTKSVYENGDTATTLKMQVPQLPCPE